VYIVTKTTDPVQDGNGVIDFTELKVSNDSEFLYLYFDTGADINLQESNVLIYIDIDNNINTGLPINGIGADIIYDFGKGEGFYRRNNVNHKFKHSDWRLISLPTVTSDRFEMAVKKRFNVGNYLIVFGSNIRIIIAHDVVSGDIIPDDTGGFLYQTNDYEYIPRSFHLNKKDERHLRVMSFNVERDRIFKNDPPFQRKIKAMQPDILCFQEVYDNSSGDMRNKIASYFGGTWYDAKVDPDIIVVSRYPIRRFEAIGGNGAFLIDYNGTEILIINVHFYCCDADTKRQIEADQIMQFIRNAKNKTGSFIIKENTPIMILGDMNFVGLNRQRKTLIEGDIFNEAAYGPDFLPDWDGSFFIDAKPVTTGFPSLFTWYNPNSSYASGRLDYIIYSGSVINLENSYVLNTELLDADVLNNFRLNAEDTQNASDHLPLIADFSLRDISSMTDTPEYGENILVYPNPIYDNIFVKLCVENASSIKARIYDTNGVKVKMQEFLHPDCNSIYSISASDLASGLYLIGFYDEKMRMIYSEKVIKY
jgi:exonuclease III